MNILTKKWTYYNEFDPKAAAWLRQLIKNGAISEGEVDERSITEVEAVDVKGYRRAHWFAGIGTWDYSLRNSGWPDDRPVWTASLPCQSFSVAGKQLGRADERHLLPHFVELVREFNPHTVFGEQVEAAIRHEWLDDLYDSFDDLGYEVASSIIPAAAVGAAHNRSRIYWVADRKGKANDTTKEVKQGLGKEASDDNESRNLQSEAEGGNDPKRSCDSENISVNSAHQRQRLYWVADSSSKGSQGHGGLKQVNDSQGWSSANGHNREGGVDSRLGNTYGSTSKRDTGSISTEKEGLSGEGELDGDLINRSEHASKSGRLGNTEHDGHFTGEEPRSDESAILSGEKGQDSTGKSEGAGTPGALSSESIEWLYCQDNKYRPIKSGLKPLVDGLTRGVVFSSDSVITPNDSAEARATRLKGYGNAIQAEVAMEFVSAFMDVTDDR